MSESKKDKDEFVARLRASLNGKRVQLPDGQEGILAVYTGEEFAAMLEAKAAGTHARPQAGKTKKKNK